MKEGKVSRRVRKEGHRAVRETIALNAALLCPGFTWEQAGKQGCRRDQPQNGGPTCAGPCTPNTAAGRILRIWRWGQPIALEVLNDKALSSGLWGRWPASRDGLQEDPGTHWPILTQASRSFSWQARQVSPPNSMAGLEPAFWEVGQIVPKAQDLLSLFCQTGILRSEEGDGTEAWVPGTAAGWLARTSGTGGSRGSWRAGTGGHPCLWGCRERRGAGASGGGNEEAEDGVSWKNGCGAADTWRAGR